MLRRPSTEDLASQIARDHRSWGYKRIAGALKNLGHKISRESVVNILKRHGVAPAPERGKRMLWKDFIQSHLAVGGGKCVAAEKAVVRVGAVHIGSQLSSGVGEETAVQ